MTIETKLPPAYRILEVAIRDYALDFPVERDPAVEQTAFPDMVSIYRSLVDGPFPPTQSAFADDVTVKVRTKLPGLRRSAVFARACRTYPSFVRQHHAVLALREHFPVVSWDRWLDQLQGVDVLVVDHRGLAAGVALSTETALARGWSVVKDDRHAKPAIPILEVYANPREYSSGPFWLHDPVSLVAGVREKLQSTITGTLAALEIEAGDVYKQAERRPKCSRQDFEAGVRGAVAFIKQRLLDTAAR
ncbi:MAG: hypothetical protein AB7P40_22710 [Chloroflexota bacterium]